MVCLNYENYDKIYVKLNLICFFCGGYVYQLWPEVCNASKNTSLTLYSIYILLQHHQMSRTVHVLPSVRSSVATKQVPQLKSYLYETWNTCFAYLIEPICLFIGFTTYRSIDHFQHRTFFYINNNNINNMYTEFQYQNWSTLIYCCHKDNRPKQAFFL